MVGLVHQPSRLSPRPGESVQVLPATSEPLRSAADSERGTSEPQDQQDDTRRDGSAGGGTGPKRKKPDDAPKRGYRACVHCRLRKAKCDLGDVNAPSEPPCSRCRREQRDCIFLPSKRRRKTDMQDDDDDRHPFDFGQPSGSSGSQRGSWQPPKAEPDRPPYQPWTETGQTGLYHDERPPSSIFAYPDLPQQSVFPPPLASDYGHSHNHGRPSRPSMTPQHSQLTRLPSQLPQEPSSHTTNLSQTTPGSLDSASTSAMSPASRTKRRQMAGGASGPDATRRIVVANFSNEVDALEILATAATDEDKANAGLSGEEGDGMAAGMGKSGKRVSWKAEEERSLAEFVLVRLGIIDEATLWDLVQAYFVHFHPFLPIFQTSRIPRTPAALANLASEDPFLVSCCVCVASRHHPEQRIREVHERVWGFLRDALSEYAFGGVEGSVGLVEGVLLLAEFLPREKSKSASDRGLMSEFMAGRGDGGLHGTENRRSWSLTGLAIRAAYGLGLDTIALEVDEAKTPESERAKLAFTWCYLYDRTIGLRTGLAFWSRGPASCFTGYSHISQTGETAAKINFPYMLSPQDTPGSTGPGGTGGAAAADNDPSRGHGADSASFIQALMELVQIMTNAHDTLYPNRQRTHSLVRQGGYFRHLDSFRRALDLFKSVWEPKEWRDKNLQELTWCTYEMVRLYISSFAFQAHVQRAWMRAEASAAASNGEKGGAAGGQGHGAGSGATLTPSSALFSGSSGGSGSGGFGGFGGATAPLMIGHSAGSVQLFPRGSATSPDALYIYASIDAATEILAICLRLSQNGVLRYLPGRYLINFVFGGVFALKAAYSGAQGRSDLARTRELVNRVSAALVLASPDREHPASRYGQMLRLLTKKLEELSEQSAVPSRFPSPEAEHTNPTLNSVPMTTTAWDQLLPDLGLGLSTGNGGGAGIGTSTGLTPQYSGPHQPYPPHGQGLNLSGLGNTPGNAANNHGQAAHQQHLMPGGMGGGPAGGPAGQGGGFAPGGVPQAQGEGMTGLEGLFDFDVDVSFNMEGFWDDFTLAEGSGFPFR